MDSSAKEIKELMDAVMRVPGMKIVTLLVDEDQPVVYDISEDGVIGYDPSHRQEFEDGLLSAFKSSGGLIIRQFLPVKVERIMPNGKKMWIPKKNIFGVSIFGGGWKGLAQYEIEQAHSIDAKTGKRLPAEPDVSFQSFPIP